MLMFLLFLSVISLSISVVLLVRASLEEEKAKNSELSVELSTVLNLLARSADKHDSEKEWANQIQMKAQAVQEVEHGITHRYTNTRILEMNTETHNHTHTQHIQEMNTSMV